MTFAQLHESIRLEMERRIERGVLTGTLLARQTGLKPAHISNFLNRKRNLSLRALDLVLASQLISLADFLLPFDKPRRLTQPGLSGASVPLVPQNVARLSPRIAPAHILELVYLPSAVLAGLPNLKPPQRRDWQRFAAVRITLDQSMSMQPLLRPGSVLVLDRYDITPRSPRTSLPCVYAIHAAADIIFAHIATVPGQLILRPHAIGLELQSIPLSPGEPLSIHIIGRVCAVTSEL